MKRKPNDNSKMCNQLIPLFYSLGYEWLCCVRAARYWSVLFGDSFAALRHLSAPIIRQYGQQQQQQKKKKNKLDQKSLVHSRVTGITSTSAVFAALVLFFLLFFTLYIFLFFKLYYSSPLLLCIHRSSNRAEMMGPHNFGCQIIERHAPRQIDPSARPQSVPVTTLKGAIKLMEGKSIRWFNR